jgi:hypothetical protein
MSIYIPLIFSVTVGSGGAPLPPPPVAPYPNVVYSGGPAAVTSADSYELRRADRDRDGRVTFEEAEARARHEFIASDRNRDRALSRREFRGSREAFYFEDINRDGWVTYGEHQSAARARFAAFDRDGDGCLVGYELGWRPEPGVRSSGWW